MNISAGWLLSGMLISCIGVGYFMYGKKEGRLYPLLAGIAMCIYPLFVTSLLLMWGACVGLMAMCWFLRDQ